MHLGSARGKTPAAPLYLAGRAVGHAGALVAGQVEVGWTGALVAAAGGEQTEVAAAAVVGLAWVVEHWEGEKDRDRESERESSTERRGKKSESLFR